jgi:hypothetical protein
MFQEVFRAVRVAINQIIGVQDTAISQMVVNEEGKFREAAKYIRHRTESDASGIHYSVDEGQQTVVVSAVFHTYRDPGEREKR